jgi:hypothetical protein
MKNVFNHTEGSKTEVSKESIRFHILCYRPGHQLKSQWSIFLAAVSRALKMKRIVVFNLDHMNMCRNSYAHLAYIQRTRKLRILFGLLAWLL